jgi:ADP-ribosylglycohydrolase
MLYGAIIGDIAGSKYEFNNIKHKPQKIMTDDCSFTDDTVMITAIAHSLISSYKFDFSAKMRAWGNRYPEESYGVRFQQWLEEGGEPYNSFGNGSAMRVSPVAWAFDKLSDVREIARFTALPTHNHPEGIKGAVATAEAIWMARNGASKDDIKSAMSNYYDIDFTCDTIRPDYTFDETCQGTVPEAIVTFLESENFEDCIKLAIALGGDSDTLATIAGSIAEAYYGVPEELIEKCKAYLTHNIINVIDTFNEMYRKDKN